MRWKYVTEGWRAFMVLVQVRYGANWVFFRRAGEEKLPLITSNHFQCAYYFVQHNWKSFYQWTKKYKEKAFTTQAISKFLFASVSR